MGKEVQQRRDNETKQRQHDTILYSWLLSLLYFSPIYTFFSIFCMFVKIVRMETNREKVCADSEKEKREDETERMQKNDFVSLFLAHKLIHIVHFKITQKLKEEKRRPERKEIYGIYFYWMHEILLQT